MKNNKWFALLSLFFLPYPFSACGEEKSSRYDLTCEYSAESRSLKGTLDFTYYNDTEKEQNVLWFQLYPNAYRADATYSPVSLIHKAAYYDGESYGGIEISSVENCRTYEIGGEDKNILFVTLREPLKRGRTSKISISFTTTLACVEHRLGIAKESVNLGNFYPVLCGYDEGKGFYECVYYSDGDPFYSDNAEYSLSLSLPKAYRLACSGNQERREEGDRAQYLVTGKNMRDIACVLSEKFQMLEKKAGDTVVRYYYYKDENAEQTLSVACRSLEYFSEKFGSYAWDTYTVAETGFCFGGMEYPALSLISDGVEGTARLETVVHETAHQWWYAMVGNNECEHAWMDEGLAEYSTMLFFDDHEEYGVKKEDMENVARNAFHSFCGIYRQLFGEVDVKLDRHLSSFVSEYEYTNIIYGKGSLLFCCVEDAVGKDRVLSSLKKYKTSYSGKNASPDQLISCFPVGAKAIFTSFLDGSAVI